MEERAKGKCADAEKGKEGAGPWAKDLCALHQILGQNEGRPRGFSLVLEGEEMCPALRQRK